MEDYRRKGMKKTFMILFILGFSLGMISLANAGAWKRDSYGWWYQNDNGSWPAGKWEWIDKRMQDREGDGEEIYVSPDIVYNTNAFEIEVNISGYDMVRLVGDNVYGYYGAIGLGNAHFE